MQHAANQLHKLQQAGNLADAILWPLLIEDLDTRKVVVELALEVRYAGMRDAPP